MQAARTKAATAGERVLEPGDGAGEPRDPDSATATSFRQWCQDTLKPAVQG